MLKSWPFVIELQWCSVIRNNKRWCLRTFFSGYCFTQRSPTVSQESSVRPVRLFLKYGSFWGQVLALSHRVTTIDTALLSPSYCEQIHHYFQVFISQMLLFAGNIDSIYIRFYDIMALNHFQLKNVSQHSVINESDITVSSSWRSCVLQPWICLVTCSRF